MNNIRIACAANTEENMVAVVGIMAENGQFIDTVNDVFTTARGLASYVSREISVDEFGTGMGYFDPLANVVFVDESDEPIKAGSTIAMRQAGKNTLSSRRIMIFVIEPGMNYVMHDRYMAASDADHKVIVESTNYETGRWAKTRGFFTNGSCYAEESKSDAILLANVLGFEIEKNTGRVYLPSNSNVEKNRFDRF